MATEEFSWDGEARSEVATTLQIGVGCQTGHLSSCWSNGSSCWHGQYLGLQFLQLPHSLLQILWAASLLCLQFHGEGASFCRSPALSNLEVVRYNHGFWPMLIGSSVSHASSLCCLPHFRCCIPSWLSELLTHSDFRSPPDTEATACHWVHQLPQLCNV